MLHLHDPTETPDIPLELAHQVVLVSGAGRGLGHAIARAFAPGCAGGFASPWARAVTGQNLIVDGGLVKN